MRKLLYALFYVSWTVQETLIKKKTKTQKHTKHLSAIQTYTQSFKKKRKSQKSIPFKSHKSCLVLKLTTLPSHHSELNCVPSNVSHDSPILWLNNLNKPRGF